MKYAFMEEHAGEFRIWLMARALKVSRSAFYRWRETLPQRSARQVSRQQFNDAVLVAFKRAKSRSGSPRLTRDLHDAGFACNRKTVAKSMKDQGLVAKAAKKFKVTTDSNHGHAVAPNLLQRDFSASGPNQKWVGDITYIRTEEGWLYLAVLLDLFSRRVVGWSISNRMKTNLVSDALMMALWNRKTPTGVIVHTDRGSQYCSKAYRKLLEKYQLKASMSGRGNCYDNACAESFFHSLKVEAIHGERFRTRADARAAIFEYIEVDYNRTRRHSACDYFSPAEYEALRA